MAYKLLAVAVEHVDDRNLDHGVCSGALNHRGACNAYENLSRKSRIID